MSRHYIMNIDTRNKLLDLIKPVITDCECEALRESHQNVLTIRHILMNLRTEESK